MTGFVLLCLWVLLAAGAQALPTRYHWRLAYGLIALGLPLVGFIGWQSGLLWALGAFAVGASVLRWPLIYLTRWLRAKTR